MITWRVVLLTGITHFPVALSGADVQIGCVPQARMPVAGRASPYDSVNFTVDDKAAQICYGRPYTKGRAIFGELIKYGELWRTGANEPTILHIPFAASIAGVDVQPGSYSIYTIPGDSTWTVILNRSTDQWGHESRYSADVEAREAGRGSVPRESLDTPVEQFTITAEPQDGGGTHMILDWEKTRVRLPITAR